MLLKNRVINTSVQMKTEQTVAEARGNGKVLANWQETVGTGSYVPRSGVDFSASDVSTPIRGSVFARSLLVQGPNFRIEANPYLFPDQVEQVFLDE